MPNYRRSRPVLCDDRLRPLLRQTLKTAKERWPFRIDAWVLLPDHLHCIWTLPEGDADFSKRWGWIKKEFGKQVRSVVGTAQLSVGATQLSVGTAHYEIAATKTGNRDLATAFLGTPHPKRSRLCRALRLYPLQSRET